MEEQKILWATYPNMNGFPIHQVNEQYASKKVNDKNQRMF